MTTPARVGHGSDTPRRDVVRAMPGSARRSLLVRGGSRPQQAGRPWWRARLVLGSTLTFALAGALAGIVHAIGVLHLLDPAQALLRYGLGAVVGGAAGFLLGLALWGLRAAVRQRRGVAEVTASRAWVHHRRTA